MFISQIKNIKINYNVDRKEVQSIHLISKTTVEKAGKAVRTFFTTLWDLKYGIGVGALAGISVSLVLAAPLSVGGIVGAAVGAMAWLVIKAIGARSPSLSNYQTPPRRISLLKLKEAMRVNQIMLKLLETSWGKQWQAVKKWKLDEAFKDNYTELFQGTCLGQTHALLKMMSSSHMKPSKELMAEMNQDDIIRSQLTHNMRVTLCNWKNRDFYEIGVGCKEEDLLRHHRNANQVHQAQLDAFKEEYALPKAERKENLMLSNTISKEGAFRTKLKNSLQALERQNPGKVIAGCMAMKLKSSGHIFFVQCNGGHFRFYDIQHGMYSFRDQDSLVAGIFKHLKWYELKGMKKAVLETYAITTA
ncbi:MAG: hypothetical protein LLG04_05200 [Parachlamydia sp.]|nr:hypothetical protein [Parachlamydia sp.]